VCGQIGAAGAVAAGPGVAVRASLAAAGAAGSVGASLLCSQPRAGAEAPEKEKIEFFLIPASDLW